MTDEPLDEQMLRDLQKQTADLPREVVPPAAAWARIKAQIDMESEFRTMTRAPRERATWQRPAFLAAAAVILIAGASLSTALVLGRRMIAKPAQPTVAENVAPQSNTPATLAEFAAIETDYIGTANRLSAMIENGDTELSPETVAKLRESLRIIDAAIVEARRALAADPANKALIEMLSTSYNQKIDLLKRTSDMGRS
jgi:hypothetical protein